ncbi:Maf family nucleotide pyrophosphatase [Undibacterium fentianense]|uniref:7-methyl-GTP pyrophosphatase n=1 Tax=Undibacterium fentianense TaxID=2828728 RepID=A0A941DZE5_9BURK|nr:Maf family nucleotide pyrophosphatase [Undibacterium fentianense]MBR7798456.1 septum formation protein Maf [Undibacterium fentianense]
MTDTLKTTEKLQLILGSSSLYRKELLARLGLPFECSAPNIDEKPLLNEQPEQTAIRLAKEKAEAVAKQFQNAIIIGSDQVAILDNEQIGKPGNHTNAMAQLQKMSGRSVIFNTALCVLDNRPNSTFDKVQLQNILTLVKFRRLSDREIENYLRIEKPYDCAGSAKNEGLGIALIESIRSDDPTALTGLPLIALTSMLRNLRVDFFQSENGNQY